MFYHRWFVRCRDDAFITSLIISAVAHQLHKQHTLVWCVSTRSSSRDGSTIHRSVIVNLLKPTCYVMHHQFNIQQLYALPTLYLCVLYLAGNKQKTCATYGINWLVFITEMKSVYSAVRTGSLNKAVCTSSLKGHIEDLESLCVSEIPLIFLSAASNMLWFSKAKCTTRSNINISAIWTQRGFMCFKWLSL
jgi:hypothetical protein